MKFTARSSNRSLSTIKSKYQQCQLLCMPGWRGTVCLAVCAAGLEERLPLNGVLSSAAQLLGFCRAIRNFSQSLRLAFLSQWIFVLVSLAAAVSGHW